jgi:hypothetical protein
MRVAASMLLLAACGGTATSIDANVVDASMADASTWHLPSAPARCATATDASTHTLGVTDPIPLLALARGATDLGLAYVVRPTPPYLAHFDFQRLALDGTPMGASVMLGPIDMSVPQPVAIAYDGAAYVACTIAVGGVSCFRVDATNHASDAGMILDATSIALANGPGGLMGVWGSNGHLFAGALDTTTPSDIATSGSQPSLAATDDGYVVGFVISSMATVAQVSASGAFVSIAMLGPARAGTDVQVSFASRLIGASYVAPSGDAMAAVVDASGAHTNVIGPNAMSNGIVSIAPARDGFFATWSDGTGTIGGSFVDPTGAPSGRAYAHTIYRNDAAHAIVSTDTDWVLATNTTSDATPVETVLIHCP